jgi:hypothetical protein
MATPLNLSKRKLPSALFVVVTATGERPIKREAYFADSLPYFRNFISALTTIIKEVNMPSMKAKTIMVKSVVKGINICYYT